MSPSDRFDEFSPAQTAERYPYKPSRIVDSVADLAAELAVPAEARP